MVLDAEKTAIPGTAQAQHDHVLDPYAIDFIALFSISSVGIPQEEEN